MKWIRRALWTTLAVLVALAVAGWLLGLYLSRDKTHVFHQVRGTYRDAAVIESWRSGESDVRLVGLRNHRGETPATAYVRRPAELAPDYKIVLIYAGAKTRERILELVPDRPDVVLLAPQYPYQSPRGLWQSLRLPHDIRLAAYRTVAGGMLAVSFLEETEGLDPDRVTVIGSSVGTAFAALHGALDERVPRVILIHGGGDFPRIIRFMERGRGRPWSGEAKARLAAIFVDTFDPIHHVHRIAPRELILIGARDDGYFPAASTEDLYARAGEPKSLIWTDTDHVRSRKSEVLEQVLALVDERITE